MILGSTYSDTVSVMASFTRPSSEEIESLVSAMAVSSDASTCSAWRRNPSPCNVSLKPAACRVKSGTPRRASRFFNDVVSDGWLT
ncbi:hypothetical protein DDE05_26480 [Streptomyces cavourensis]|nr:hypothetical protein DDE05_26480 [Streptomyces cavourensis]